ncbi:phosphotransferase [Bacillus cereus]
MQIVSSGIKQVLERYGISEKVQLRKLTSGTVNSLYKLSHEDMKLVLRNCRMINSKARIQFILQALLELHNNEIPVPKILYTEEEELYYYLNNQLWILMEYVEGSTYEYKNIKQLKSAANYLGKIHSISIDSLVEFYEPFQQSMNLWFDQPFNLLDETKQICEAVLKEKADVCWNRFYDAIDMISSVKKEQLEMLPLAFCHGDYHGLNLKFLNNEVRGIYDFDNFDIRPRLFDICYSLLMLTRHKRGAYDLDKDSVRTFIEAYQKSSYPLTDIEKELFIPFMIVSYLPDNFYLNKMVEVDGDILRSIKSYEDGLVAIKKYQDLILSCIERK